MPVYLRNIVLILMIVRLKAKPGAGQGVAVSVQHHAAADAAQKRRLEENREKMCEHAVMG
jgi:hypothetical protein